MIQQNQPKIDNNEVSEKRWPMHFCKVANEQSGAKAKVTIEVGHYSAHFHMFCVRYFFGVSNQVKLYVTDELIN